jgi:hypothetical protein
MDYLDHLYLKNTQSDGKLKISLIIMNKDAHRGGKGGGGYPPDKFSKIMSIKMQ